MMRLIHVAVVCSVLCFQSANALTVTLETDFRAVDYYDFVLVDRQRAAFGEEFSYEALSRDGSRRYGYQYSSTPTQSDSSTYVFSGEGASMSYEGSAGWASRYEISFTPDQDAAFNLDAVFDYREVGFSGGLDQGKYEIYFYTGNDYNGGPGALFSESGTVYENSPIAFNESFQLTAGTTYKFNVLTSGSQTSSGTSSMAGYNFNGSITTVPIPTAAWLFGSALAGLGWFRRKQTV